MILSESLSSLNSKIEKVQTVSSILLQYDFTKLDFYEGQWTIAQYILLVQLIPFTLRLIMECDILTVVLSTCFNYPYFSQCVVCLLSRKYLIFHYFYSSFPIFFILNSFLVLIIFSFCLLSVSDRFFEKLSTESGFIFENLLVCTQIIICFFIA